MFYLEMLDTLDQTPTERFRMVVEFMRGPTRVSSDDVIALAQERDRLAQMVYIQVGSGRTMYSSRSADSFRTQGMGADHYRRGWGEVWAELIRARGVPAEVVHTQDETQVWLPLNDLQTDAVRCWPDSVRLYLKACWSRALNPRVFLFLPHGLEERYGVTYQGGDVPGHPASEPIDPLEIAEGRGLDTMAQVAIPRTNLQADGYRLVAKSTDLHEHGYNIAEWFHPNTKHIVVEYLPRNTADVRSPWPRVTATTREEQEAIHKAVRARLLGR